MKTQTCPNLLVVLAAMLVLACLLGLPQCSRATTLVVTNLADSGPGTLRGAIASASSGDTITFATNGTITLATGLIITNHLTIAGPGPANLAIDGSVGGFSLLTIAPSNVVTLASLKLTGGNLWDDGGGIYVDSGATLTITNCTIYSNSVTEFTGGGICNLGMLTVNNCTISGNSVNGSPSEGGGIYNGGTLTLNNSTLSRNFANSLNEGGGAILNAGTLTVNNCTLSDNYAIGYSASGGGILNYGTLILDNCTLSGNSALGGDNAFGGGIINGGTLMLDNCTLSGNSAVNGGGICTDGGTNTLNNCTLSGNSALTGGGIYRPFNGIIVITILTNTIVAGNTATNAPDIYDLLASYEITAAHSLTNGDPLLAPLGNYGGPTQTMPPLAGSPAIDAGLDSITNFLATDQRGRPRLSGAHVDLGAVEAQYAPANNPPHLINAASSGIGGNHSFQFTFTNVPDADFSVLASANLALPLSDWIPIGNAAQNPPGQYQFSDSGATNYPQRFYQVVSP